MKIEINAANLSWGALIDIEEAKTTGAIARWLVEHAGCDMNELRALPATEIASIADQVGQLLKQSLNVGKLNG